jgi:hypothetical protein
MHGTATCDVMVAVWVGTIDYEYDSSIELFFPLEKH